MKSRKDYNHSYYLTHKAKITAVNLAWQRAHPESRRNSQLKNKYGIGSQQVEAILESQGGVCAICRRPQEELRHPTPRLHVDHVTVDGVVIVRGLLCGRCNKALGLLRDDPTIAVEVVRYLRKKR
jgi:hypothetical protein